MSRQKDESQPVLDRQRMEKTAEKSVTSGIIKESRANLKQYQRIVAASQDSISIVDRNYIYREVNPSYLKKTGKAYFEIVGHSISELFGTRLFEDLLKAHLDRCFKGETVSYRSWFNFPADGSRFMDVTYSPYRDDNGDIIGAVVISRDITELKNVEDRLRLSEKSLLAQNRIAEILLLSDRQSVYDNMLRVLVEIFNCRYAFIGYLNRRGELVCESMTRVVEGICNVEGKGIIFPHKGRAGIWGQSIEQKKPFRKNHTLELPEGHIPIKNALVVPILLKDEAIGQFTLADKPGGFIDEDEKLLELIASRIAPILKSWTEKALVEEEKKDLEKQLRQSRKMEAIGTLAGGIAHDFNNILFPIVGYTEMCMDDMAPETASYRYLTRVMEATRRAQELIRQILTFSRQTEGEKQPLQLILILKEVIKLLRASLPATIEIRQNLKSKSFVTADPTEIHQILMNLCTNAYHSMRNNIGILSLELDDIDIEPDTPVKELDLIPGSYIKLEIRDTGHGMAPALMERIFEPYFTTKEPEKGTGLGLAIVHGIVKKMNGDISVVSEIGTGSTFNIYLPTTKIANDPSQYTVETSLPEGKETILLVDDEDTICVMLQKSLSKLGYTVESYTSALDALAIFEENPQEFDLLITDLTMPRMTGIDLIRKITAIRPSIPAILLTGYGHLIDEEKIKSLGIRKLIMKPVLKKDIAEGVRYALQQEKD